MTQSWHTWIYIYIYILLSSPKYVYISCKVMFFLVVLNTKGMGFMRFTMIHTLATLESNVICPCFQCCDAFPARDLHGHINWQYWLAIFSSILHCHIEGFQVRIVAEVTPNCAMHHLEKHQGPSHEPQKFCFHPWWSNSRLNSSCSALDFLWFFAQTSGRNGWLWMLKCWQKRTHRSLDRCFSLDFNWCKGINLVLFQVFYSFGWPNFGCPLSCSRSD